VAEFQELAKGWGLRDIEGKKLIMIEVTGAHGGEGAPSASEANGGKKHPAVVVRESREEMEQANGQKRARWGC
jgi:hypothetical protein